MYVAQALVKSDKASSYLMQLCKHFAHKAPAHFDETSGRVQFKPGVCVMQVAGNVLRLRCEANSEPELQEVKAVVANHLVRFAWRENLTITWDAADRP